MDPDLKDTQFLATEESLEEAKDGRALALLEKKATVARNKRLMKKMKDQKELLVTMEANIEEMEEECADLRKDNNDLLDETDNDAAHKEDFDMEPPSDPEDDDQMEEEDPEELVFEPEEDDKVIIEEDTTAHHHEE